MPKRGKAPRVSGEGHLDEVPAADVVDNPDLPIDDPPPTGVSASDDDLAIAERERKAMAEHWNERDQLDLRSAGGILVQHSLWGDAFRRLIRNRLAVLAILLLAALVLLSIFVPIIDDTDPNADNFPNRFAGVSMEHPFGTDYRGRDMWVRAWLGGRISLAIGFAVALAILIVGVIYGSISGYVGGRTDNAMMRLLDSLYGLPYIPFAIIFITIAKTRLNFEDPLMYMVPALSITTWFTAARIVRGQVLSLKQNDYVDAARSQGAAWPRIVFRHVVPNALGVLVIAAFLEVPGAILGEATLSFLGLGVDLPHASWGSMAYDGFHNARNMPRVVAVPGILIALTVLSAIAIADGVRDALDPRGTRN